MENVGVFMPLIQEGIIPPVRKPTQSFVKELQLKSKPEFQRDVDTRPFPVSRVPRR